MPLLGRKSRVAPPELLQSSCKEPSPARGGLFEGPKSILGWRLTGHEGTTRTKLRETDTETGEEADLCKASSDDTGRGLTGTAEQESANSKAPA